MKTSRFISFVLILGALVLSACGAAAGTPTAAPQAPAGPKVEAMPVAFVGIVDSIAGDQWVISGTTVTVDESIVRDGPFHVGDQVKVEGLVNPDGSFTVSRLEAPAPQEPPTVPPVVADNSNDALDSSNTNDANVNDDNSNDDNSNDDSGNSNDDSGNSNDDSGNSNDDNSGDDNSNGDNSNDDSGNSNDDSGGNSNDDNGGNSNDDSSGGNSNDDSGGGNSNDDSSGGGGNDNGSDDNGGNSNDG